MDIKSIYSGVASNALGNVLMLVATLWLTRILSPDEFGQFRVGSSFAVLLIPFLALGGERIISTIIQSRKDAGQPVARALATVFIVTGIGVVVLAALYPLILPTVLGGNVPLGVYLLSIAIIPLTIAYNLANTIWRHVGSTSSAQVHLNLVQRAFRAPLLVGLSFAWPNAISASLAMFVAQAISLVQVRRHLLAYPARMIGGLRQAIADNYRIMLVVGLPVAVLASVDRLDVLLVNGVMGVDKAGTYDIVFLLSLTAMFPAMALAKSSEPFLLGLASDAGQLRQLRRLQLRAFLLSIAGAAGIAVVAPLLTPILGNAGPEFAPAAIALSAGLAFSSSSGPVIEYLQINGRARLVLIVTAVMLPIFFGLKYLAASVDSLVGVAALAGLFYFTLRAILALIIRLVDGIMLTNPVVLAISAIGCLGAVTFIIWGFGL